MISVKRYMPKIGIIAKSVVFSFSVRKMAIEKAQPKTPMVVIKKENACAREPFDEPSKTAKPDKSARTDTVINRIAISCTYPPCGLF